MQVELEALTDAGVICRTETADGEDAYAPCLPESLTIAECIGRLDTAGDDDMNPTLRESEGELFAASTRLLDAALNSPDNLRLAAMDAGN